MADIDLIASDDSPFDAWVREAAKQARDALMEIRTYEDRLFKTPAEITAIIDRGLGKGEEIDDDCYHGPRDAPEEGDEDSFEDAQQTYKIVRYRQEGSQEVRRRGLTLAEAKAHCNDPATSGDGWFDGWTAE